MTHKTYTVGLTLIISIGLALFFLLSLKTRPQSTYVTVLTEQEYLEITPEAGGSDFVIELRSLPYPPAQFCAMEVVDNLEDLHSTELQCFDSLEELGLEIGVSASHLLLLLHEDETKAILNVPVVGIDYDRIGYNGSVTLFTTTGKTCFSGATFYAPSVPFDNWTESIRGASGCNTQRAYEHVNFGGAVRTCRPNCATLGVLNNQVSSRQFAP